MLFLALAIFTFGGFIPFTKGGYDFMVITTQSDKMPKGYKFPNIRDMDLMLYSAVFFAAIEFICRKVFYVMFVPYCKEQ